jgi:AcrR family transcriptional regulator
MGVQGRPRGNYAKTAARREEIIEASLAVFSEFGYRSGSIRKIAERVGLSQAGLLHHFANKMDLLGAVLDRRDEIDQRHIVADAELGIGSLRNLILLAEFNEQTRGLVELHCTLSAEATARDHPAHDYFVKRYERVIFWTTRSFTALHEKGQLADGIDPHFAARDLVALMDGLQVQWLLQDESFSMADAIRNYVRPMLTIEL